MSDVNVEEGTENMPNEVNTDATLTDCPVSINEDTVAAAGFSIEDPITNALIGNLKGTLPTKKQGEANIVLCEVCDCKMSSATVYQFHINGAKHKRKLKALEIVEQLKATGEQGLELGKDDDPNAFRCEVCNLTVNSAQQLEVHLEGAKHKNKVAKAGGTTGKITAVATDPTGPPAKKKKKDDPMMFQCHACNVILNSQQQYEQHMQSKKHLSKVNPPDNQGKNRPRGAGGFGRPPFNDDEGRPPYMAPMPFNQNDRFNSANPPRGFVNRNWNRPFNPNFMGPNPNPLKNNFNRPNNNNNNFRGNMDFHPFQRAEPFPKKNMGNQFNKPPFQNNRNFNNQNRNFNPPNLRQNNDYMGNNNNHFNHMNNHGNSFGEVQGQFHKSRGKPPNFNPQFENMNNRGGRPPNGSNFNRNDSSFGPNGPPNRNRNGNNNFGNNRNPKQKNGFERRGGVTNFFPPPAPPAKLEKL